MQTGQGLQNCLYAACTGLEDCGSVKGDAFETHGFKFHGASGDPVPFFIKRFSRFVTGSRRRSNHTLPADSVRIAAGCTSSFPDLVHGVLGEIGVGHLTSQPTVTVRAHPTKGSSRISADLNREICSLWRFGLHTHCFGLVILAIKIDFLILPTDPHQFDGLVHAFATIVELLT